MEKSPTARFLRRLVDLREGETATLTASAAYFFLLLSGYYVLRAVREQSGTAGDSRWLAWTFTATLVGMVLANPVYAWMVTRWPRERFIPVVLRVSALCLLAFCVAMLFAPFEWQRGVSRTFFVWLSVFNLFAVAVFWSFMADVWSFEQGKRLFGLVSVGGSLGAIAGSGFTAAFAPALGPAKLLLLSTLLLEASVRAMRLVARTRGLAREAIPAGRTSVDEARAPEQIEHGSLWTGFALVARSSYLAWICLYMALGSLAGTILYFEQNQIVRAFTEDPGERTAIFARIDLAVNVLTLIVQLFLTGRIVKAIGVGPTLVLQCVALGLALPLLGLSPTLGVMAVAMVLFRTGHYATSRPARETLFTVVGREARYKSKAFIDTFVYRGGDALGGWSFQALEGLGLQGVAFVSVPIALVWGATGLVLGRLQRRVASKQASGS